MKNHFNAINIRLNTVKEKKNTVKFLKRSIGIISTETQGLFFFFFLKNRTSKNCGQYLKV